MAEEAAAGGLYYCHMCASTVSAVAAAEGEVEIKCPYCHSGFVEEIESARGAAAAGGGGAISSVWAPIIDGMVGGGGDAVRRHRRSRRLADAGADDGYYRDLALIDFSESRRRTAALLLLMQEFRERQLQRLESATATISTAATSAGGGSSGDAEGVALADYFLGPGLDALMQRLGDGDAGRQGTLPAKKEAVEAMPTVEVTSGDSASASACAVCLEDYAAGERATEMPCRHRFHAKCIVPWLKMHSSCPVCRFQLPTDDDDDDSKATRGGVSSRRLSQPAARVDGGGLGRLPAVMQELRSILSQPSPSPSPGSTSGSSSHSQQHSDD
uniref:RING-type E3 ubiquitin transferase n=1 Tax=Oryza punctata TaxID=4537 RepID=A0A0E0JH16_ORYPU